MNGWTHEHFAINLQKISVTRGLVDIHISSFDFDVFGVTFLWHLLATKLYEVHYKQCLQEHAGHVHIFTIGLQFYLMQVEKMSFVETGKKVEFSFCARKIFSFPFRSYQVAMVV